MGRIRDLAEGLWSGELDPAEHHPFAPLLDLEPVAARTAFVSKSFANATAFETPTEGLVLVDTGSFLLAHQVKVTVRSFTARPLHTAVYTHGHVDHCFGVDLLRGRAARPRPRRGARARAGPVRRRYRLTHGYNACINARQVSGHAPGRWPEELPARRTSTYGSSLRSRRGRGALRAAPHAMGETDRRDLECGSPRARWSAWGTSSSGLLAPTPATRRRCSATRASGRRRSARSRTCPPRCCAPGHGPPMLRPASGCGSP